MKITMDVDPEEIFVPTYKRGGAPMTRGEGMYLYDADEKKYLDFGAGVAVNALGHSHPALVAAARAQAEKLIHASNLYYIDAQLAFAQRLVESSFAGKVFLCNSGTEANEGAIKFARKFAAKNSAQKFHILSFSESFHGRTYGSLSATAQMKFHSGFGPLPDGFHYAPFNDVQCAKAMLDKYDFAAIIVEPLQGEGGVNVADAEFLKFLRDYATANSIALIFDEIQCGTGRCGTFWYYEQTGVVPDIMTVAKPIGGGLPLGAVLCTNEIAACITPGDHGTTFGGNPVACAVGSCVIDIVSDAKFLDDVNANGKYLRDKLENICAKHSAKIEPHVRGVGLLLGVRFKDDPAAVIERCRDNGLLLIRANLNTVRFMPPLNVGRDDIDIAVKIFDEVLSSM